MDTHGFCMTCFQHRLVTGCSNKSLLWNRNQTQFPHITYSCQCEGHTPNIPKRDAGNWLRPWTLLLPLCTAWKGLFLHRYIGTFLVFTGLHEASVIRTVVFTPTLSFKGHATEGRDRMKEENSLAQTGRRLWDHRSQPFALVSNSNANLDRYKLSFSHTCLVSLSCSELNRWCK